MSQKENTSKVSLKKNRSLMAIVRSNTLFFNGPRIYSFVNVKIHSKKNHLLRFTEYEKLLKAQDAEDVARILGTTTYGEKFSQELLEALTRPTLLETEHLLGDNFQEEYQSLAKHLPASTKKIMKLMDKKYFLDSLKVILRGKHLQFSKTEIDSYIYSPMLADIDVLKRLNSFDSIDTLIDSIADKEIRKELKNILPLYEEVKSTILFDITLDHIFYTQMWEEMKNLRKEAGSSLNLLGIEIDLLNIQTILRCKVLGLNRKQIEQSIIPVNFRIRSLEPYITSRTVDIGGLLQQTYYKQIVEQGSQIFESPEILNLNRYEFLMKQFLAHEAMKVLAFIKFDFSNFFAFFTLRRIEHENIRAIIIAKKAKTLDIDSIKDNIIIF